MGRDSKIEWTDATWNPIRGCSRISSGCDHCYAESVAARFSGPGQAYEGLAEFRTHAEGTESERVEAHWTGKIRFVEPHLRDPLKWKEPLRMFVNSMSDLFHPGVTSDMLGEIFHVMAKAPQHTYQILTKRPDRMLEALEAASHPDVVDSFHATYGQPWPPPNWIFGVSIEDQETANRRLPILARCKCAKRMVSYEPAIGPVDFTEAMGGDPRAILAFDWIIVGGESGHRARPMHPNWARSVRDLCASLGIAFFFKQWGEWRVGESADFLKYQEDNSTGQFMVKVGKHHSGSALDGVEWKEFPQC